MLIKFRYIFIGVFLCVTFALSGVFAHASTSDRVLAVVNDEIITQRDFDRIYESVIARLRQSGLKEEEIEEKLADMEGEILEQLVNAKLVISLAKESGIEVDREEVDEKIEAVKSYYPSREVFLHDLDQKGSNLSEFRSELKEQLLAQRLVEQKIGSGLSISPGELKKLYEKNKEEFFTPREYEMKVLNIRRDGSEGGGKQKIERIRARLNASPESFDELIKQFSEGPFASEGGKMGFVGPRDIGPDIYEAVSDLEEGEFSEIISTDLGYHIFQVQKIKQPRQLEFNEVRNYLRERAHMKRFEENLAEWLEEEKGNAHISYR